MKIWKSGGIIYIFATDNNYKLIKGIMNIVFN